MDQTVSPSTSRADSDTGSEKLCARKPCQSTATRGASRLSRLGHSHQGAESSSHFEGIPLHGTKLCGGTASLAGAPGIFNSGLKFSARASNAREQLFHHSGVAADCAVSDSPRFSTSWTLASN